MFIDFEDLCFGSMRPVVNVPKWKSAFSKRLLMAKLQFKIRMLKLEHSICAAKKNVSWRNLLKRSNKSMVWELNQQVKEL